MRRLIITFKSMIIDIIRPVLLFLVMFLPLIFILVITELSVKFVFVFDLSPDIDLIYPSLFLFAVGTFIHYFFGRYGSAYKLPFVLIIRDDAIQQLLDKHHEKALPDIQMALIAGSAIYIVVITNLLTELINSHSVVSKTVVGIVITLLLIYVLPNKKYENVISLIKKIWR